MMEKFSISKELDIVSNGNPKAKRELINIFIKQTNEDILKLDAYLQSKNWNELKNLIHRMKSTLTYFNQSRVLILADLLMKDSEKNTEATINWTNEFVKICKQLVHFLEYNSDN